MLRRIVIFLLVIAFASSAFARSITHVQLHPIYDNCTEGNPVPRMPMPTLYILQEQQCIYIPQGYGEVRCFLYNGNMIVFDRELLGKSTVEFPCELQGDFELVLNVEGVSYIGVIKL